MADTAMPTTTGSGTGATPAEIGGCRRDAPKQDQDREIWDKWWDDQRITSIEGDGSTWTGRDALNAKNQAWEAENEILEFRIKAVRRRDRVLTAFRREFKPPQRRHDADDRSGGYTVENGKVVREEFILARVSRATRLRPTRTARTRARYRAISARAIRARCRTGPRRGCGMIRSTRRVIEANRSVL